MLWDIVTQECQIMQKKKYSEKKPGNKIQIKTWGPKMEISFQKCPVLAKLSSP